MRREISTVLDSLATVPKANMKQVQGDQARVDGDTTHSLSAIELKKIGGGASLSY